MRWRFGAIEAVSMIIFIGYAVDYTMHIAQIFHRTPDDLVPYQKMLAEEYHAASVALKTGPPAAE